MTASSRPDDAVIGAVRMAIYGAIERTGAAPDHAALARALELDAAVVEQAVQALADAHVIVLHPNTTSIKWAPPFSTVPTPFRVRVGRSEWHAPCAWDAFGIPAALDRDARIEAASAWSGEPIPCGVEHGLAYGDGIIHLLVPAAHFWDDIGYT
jgi:alkylmercury lyase-like protein